MTPPDLLWRALRYRLRIERAEIAFLLSTLRGGDRAADIGAHKGAYTYWMRRAVGRRGKVFAFEIQPELVAYLRRAFRGDEAVVVEHLGVSDRAGLANASVPAAGVSCGATLEARPVAEHRVQVRTVPLDEYFANEPLSLIKCDVEGHELRVFQGAERVLREQRPALIFECEQRHQDGRAVREIFHWLERRGYEGRYFLRGRWRGVDSFTPDLQRDPHARGYVNNFVFQFRGA